MDVNPGERPPAGSLKVILRALSHRNYRLFFAGQSVSLLGTFMQQIAMNWLVFYLTGNAFMLGVVSFVSTLPLLLLGPVAGVWVDRWDRRRTLLYTQGLLLVEAFVLAALALTGVIDVWQILVLSALAGFVNALDGATRSAFLPEMVEKKSDLSSAIALSSFIMYGARMLGPPLAGALIAWVGKEAGVVEGTGVCFLLNGLSYVGVCVALAAMHTAPVAAAPLVRKPMLSELKEGLAYVLAAPPIRDLIVIQGLVSLLGSPYALMPVVAREVLHGDASTLGLLMGAAGLGAVAGAVLLAVRQGVRGTLGRIALAGIVLGLGQIAFSFSHELWLSVGILIVIGFSLMVVTVAAFTLLQTIVADDKRGRVISLFMLATWGMTPLGSLILGSLADRAGVTTAFLVSGLGCLIGFAWFAAQLAGLRPLVEGSGDEGDVHSLARPHES